MTGKMSRKGFFATLAAVIGGAGAATGAKAVGGVDRYAVVSVPRKQTLANIVSDVTIDWDVTTHSTIPPPEAARLFNDLSASLRQQDFTL